MARHRPRLRRRALRRAPRPSPTAPADAEILGRVPYFRSLSAAELGALARRCSSRALAPGETLFEEGAACTRLFVITSGRIEVRQTSLRGREQVFHTEQPGAALGEAPLFDGGGYIASAVAVETSRVLSLSRPRLIALCRTHPDVALAIVETLARRVRRFAELVGDLAFRPVPERLARYLVATAERRPLTPGLELHVQLTQARLAARLGTVRELVARAMAQMEQAGVISRKGPRVISVRDPVRLVALAEGRGE
jgi:CRP/FNR family cyclic AMP-dependent transcriptional regulator